MFAKEKGRPGLDGALAQYSDSRTQYLLSHTKGISSHHRSRHTSPCCPLERTPLVTNCIGLQGTTTDGKWKGFVLDLGRVVYFNSLCLRKPCLKQSDKLCEDMYTLHRVICPHITFFLLPYRHIRFMQAIKLPSSLASIHIFPSSFRQHHRPTIGPIIRYNACDGT